MTNQFFTICNRCGKQILMTQTEKGWMPCHPVIGQYKRSGGPLTFISADGKVCRGQKAFGGEFGYERHWGHCKV